MIHMVANRKGTARGGPLCGMLKALDLVVGRWAKVNCPHCKAWHKKHKYDRLKRSLLKRADRAEELEDGIE